MSTPRPTSFHHPYPPHQPPSLPPPPPPSPTVEVTIISGKHLKNVNWKNGDLKPYAILWVDPDHKLTTKSDDFSGTKPVWNQRFSLPTSSAASSAASSADIVFTLEVFHSKAAETPKPFVGSLSIRLSSLPEPDNVSKVRTFELLRPSGRPQGKIRLKIGLNYQNVTSYGGFYYGNGPQFRYPYYGGSGYGAAAAAAPSAPVDYSPYETRSRFGVGAVGGALVGLALDDGVKYENDNVAVGCSSSTVKDDFSEYRADY